MFTKIISGSLANPVLVLAFTLVLIIAGTDSMLRLPLDAVPDITNNQVQVVTNTPTLAAAEVEEMITFPLEMAVSNIPDVVEVRSISRYGLSVITIVFEEGVENLHARQLVSEQITLAEIPEDLGRPQLMPITTGLGEIYQYVLTVDSAHSNQYSLTELRTLQDWVVKRMMAGTKGIVEVSSFGGFVKQYEVSANPTALASFNVTLEDLANAVEANNRNSGGSYIDKEKSAFYIRSTGRAISMDDIGKTVIKIEDNSPVTVNMVAEVKIGSPKRYGAMTMDGKGEVVGGITLMLKGESSSLTLTEVKQRIDKIKSALPNGIDIYPYLDRSVLIDKTIATVQTNLTEGGLIVIFILLLLLGNIKAGLLVASVIPLSLLFAFIMMRIFGVSANLMSLGAVDFGIVVDGAVIVVEGILFFLHTHYHGQKISGTKMNEIISVSAGRIYNSAAMGVFIILVVFIPVLMLEGIEGKMFRPMALTVGFAIIGSLLLSLTWVPVMSSFLFRGKIKPEAKWVSNLMRILTKAYMYVLNPTLKFKTIAVISSFVFLMFSFWQFSRLGSEFIPTLEEGDLAMQLSVPPGSSLNYSIESTTRAEKILKKHFPEVKHVVSKIGTAEVPTDPMAIEDSDVMIILKDKEEWTTASSREELISAMQEKLKPLENEGISMEFSQPIQLRFNELMTGSKADLAVKVFGTNTDTLRAIAKRLANSFEDVQGAADVKVEQTEGLQQIVVEINRSLLSTYGVTVEQVNHAIRTAYGGTSAGYIYEDDRRFDLTVRLNQNYIGKMSPGSIFIRSGIGELIPLSAVTKITESKGPMQISHEKASRRINIGINVRNRDIASLVKDIQKIVKEKAQLPAGYFIEYGGQFENLEKASGRLLTIVPVALLLILFLLYMAVKNFSDSLMIFTAVPLSAIGGIWALWIRDLPFSISAGVGFIALFGVAVLNGLVLISEIRRLQNQESLTPANAVLTGAASRFRPVLMTALVAALGFLPMAMSHGSGAEVQRPLATVVIGGLISSTLLTLFILPSIYLLINKIKIKRTLANALFILLTFAIPERSFSQNQTNKEYDLNALLESAKNHQEIKNLATDIEINKHYLKNMNPWPASEITGQFGQINSSKTDYQFQFRQSFGNPLLNKWKKNYLETEAIQIQSEINNNLALRSWQITELYYRLQITYRILEELNLLLPEVMSLDTTLLLQQEKGEISFLDRQVILQIKQKFELQIFEARSEIEKINSEIKILAGTTSNAIIPQNTDFIYNYIPPDSVLNAATVYTEPARFELDKQASLIAVTKNSYKPQPFAGGFVQSLDHINAFAGIMLGVNIPIVKTGKKHEIHIAELQYQKSEQILLESKRYYSLLLQQYLEKFRIIKNNFNPQEFADNKDISEAIKTAILRFKNGDINHITLNQYLTTLSEQRIYQLQIADKYNTILIAIKFLTL